MSTPISAISDLHAHDIPLDLAISPEGIHRFNQKNRLIKNLSPNFAGLKH